jgi:hypothetical protein
MLLFVMFIVILETGLSLAKYILMLKGHYFEIVQERRRQAHVATAQGGSKQLVRGHAGFYPPPKPSLYPPSYP